MSVRTFDEVKISSNGAVHPDIVFPNDKERPCYRAYPSLFRVDGEWKAPGVYWHGFNDKDPDDKWILSYLKVLGITKTPERTEYSYLMEYSSQGDPTVHQGMLLQSLMVGNVDKLMVKLRDMGITVLYKNRELIRSYLDSQCFNFKGSDSSNIWTSVKTLGWYGKETFVLPHQIIGRKNNVIFTGKFEEDQYGTTGDYSEWKKKVAEFCVGNDYLIFSLAASFAGSLLHELNITGIGFHLDGDSTTGKTTAQQVSGSSWGPREFVMSWNSTGNHLEDAAASRSGLIALLDESHQIDPRHLDNAIYALLNAEGKGRLNADSSAKKKRRWRICLLSSGENSLESRLRTAGIDHKAGQEVRITNVEVAHGSQHGLFDNIHGQPSARAFSDMLRINSSEHYGFAGPAFVQWLIDNPKVRTSLPVKRDEILQGFGTALTAQEGRVAGSFAVVALAGELAIDAGILPWEKGSAQTSAISLFDNWRYSKPSGSSTEHSQVMQKISSYIDRYADSRFTNIKPKTYFKDLEEKECVEQEKVLIRSGYYEDFEDRRIFLFNSDGLHEATKGLDFPRVIRALEDAKAFTRKGYGSERADVRRLPGKGRQRLYHIDPDKLT